MVRGPDLASGLHRHVTPCLTAIPRESVLAHGLFDGLVIKLGSSTPAPQPCGLSPLFVGFWVLSAPPSYYRLQLYTYQSGLSITRCFQLASGVL